MFYHSAEKTLKTIPSLFVVDWHFTRVILSDLESPPLRQQALSLTFLHVTVYILDHQTELTAPILLEYTSSMFYHFLLLFLIFYICYLKLEQNLLFLLIWFWSCYPIINYRKTWTLLSGKFTLMLWHIV